MKTIHDFDPDNPSWDEVVAMSTAYELLQKAETLSNNHDDELGEKVAMELAAQAENILTDAGILAKPEDLECGSQAHQISFLAKLGYDKPVFVERADGELVIDLDASNISWPELRTRAMNAQLTGHGPAGKMTLDDFELLSQITGWTA